MDALGAIRSAKRLVVKVGSALLVEGAAVRHDWLRALIAEMAGLKAQLIFVSSGAIRLGIGRLGYEAKGLDLSQNQAAAAVGQIALAGEYERAAQALGLKIGQILLTQEDTESRGRYLNARGTLQALLEAGVIPLVNENDTVATDEIRFGDNDRLAARVAALVGADCLLILSDIDGLYTANPRLKAEAQHLPLVKGIDAEIFSMASHHDDPLSKGGMETKLLAAQIALAAGTNMVLADGREIAPLSRLERGARATLFAADRSPARARKAWIAGNLKPMGEVHIDLGAVRALKSGKSLLPVGATYVQGDFERGAAVQIIDPAGMEIARGLAAYSAGEARKILGLRTDEIEEKLGYIRTKALIHANDMVLL